MSDYQVWDSDDFGCSHVISDMCQSRDCRGELLKLKEVNPAFKITLFTIPDESTIELLEWSKTNRDWVEIAQHGFTHSSNYECEKMSYDDFDGWMNQDGRKELLDVYFAMGFKAPGWQISDDIYKWLVDNEELPVYKVGENSVHGHTWSCMGNGIDETLPQLLEKVKQTDNFKFVSEVVQ